MDAKKSSLTENRILKALMPLAAALLAIVCLSGVFIYPYLFHANSISGPAGQLAEKLLVTALVAQIAALIPAVMMSFTRDDFSISLTYIVSLTAAVFFSWIAMVFQKISPIVTSNFSGGVLNVMLTALIGTVLSIIPAAIATGVCILRRIIGNLIDTRR